MIPAAVRAVFFDAVGTLIHPQPSVGTVYTSVARRFGSRLTETEITARFEAAFARQEFLDRQQGLRTSEAREWQRWRTIVGEVLEDVAHPEPCFVELFEHFGQPQSWHCAPDAAEVLPELTRRGYVLGLASNYDRRLLRVVSGWSALQQLPHCIISSDIGWRKPAAAFFTALGRAVTLAPEQILFVGDDPINDYEGARVLGPARLAVRSRGIWAPGHGLLAQVGRTPFLIQAYTSEGTGRPPGRLIKFSWSAGAPRGRNPRGRTTSPWLLGTDGTMSEVGYRRGSVAVPCVESSVSSCPCARLAGPLAGAAARPLVFQAGAGLRRQTRRRLCAARTPTLIGGRALLELGREAHATVLYPAGSTTLCGRPRSGSC